VAIVPNRNPSGLDASISFETDRPENLGLVFNVDPNAGEVDISFVNTTIIGVSNVRLPFKRHLILYVIGLQE
jgi:hypothetical protein